jgi:hypothetical protein
MESSALHRMLALLQAVASGVGVLVGILVHAAVT